MQPAYESPGPSRAEIVIAVDGPSGSGKSSTARGVASRLGLRYLDTGAMYRAVTWWMLQRGVDVEDPAAIAVLADVPQLDSGTDPGTPTITVDGTDVSVAIRTSDVTNAVSAVSAVPAVRASLVAKQRASIGAGGIVVEGRDIGTVVAPDAAVKVFLTATATERAQRRNAELPRDATVSVESTHADLHRRDRFDSSRAASPLLRAEDAYEIDSTALDLDGVVEVICDLVRTRTGVA